MPNDDLTDTKAQFHSAMETTGDAAAAALLLLVIELKGIRQTLDESLMSKHRSMPSPLKAIAMALGGGLDEPSITDKVDQLVQAANKRRDF